MYLDQSTVRSCYQAKPWNRSQPILLNGMQLLYIHTPQTWRRQNQSSARIIHTNEAYIRRNQSSLRNQDITIKSRQDRSPISTSTKPTAEGIEVPSETKTSQPRVQSTSHHPSPDTTTPTLLTKIIKTAVSL